MRKFTLFFAALCCAITANAVPTGALSGKFSVGAARQIQFSRGNLQYQASTDTWRFAEHQYDMIGLDNVYISPTYSGWIDLFGWGTGNNPTLVSLDWKDYKVFTDWGTRAISNGGNQANLWHTLTKDEWLYLIRDRSNAPSLIGLATVNNVTGIILLPDDWITPSGLVFNDFATKGLSWDAVNYEEYTDGTEVFHYEDNVYSSRDWSKMEAAGAVFLPAAGDRIDQNPLSMNEYSSGYYWSSTPFISAVNGCAYYFFFNAKHASVMATSCHEGYAVRLVTETDDAFLKINNVEVTSNNCDDILPTEGFLASFDMTTNTLHLKTSAPDNWNVLNSIHFYGMDLRIVVEGQWRINGSIVGVNGDLSITANHFALIEEEADALEMKPGDNTAITLEGHRLTLSNRLWLICDNAEIGHTPQSAVKCNDMWVNNSWLEAWGKTPVVDCAYGSVVNATITNGSFKNNDVIQVEPDITKYVVWVDVYDNVAGSVTGGGLVNEGTSHTITATPKNGYHFLRWSNGVTENPYTFVVTRDTALYALFEADEILNYYDINVVSADETMGTVSGGGTHIGEGQIVTITATPNEGYEFLYWTTANGQVQGVISQWIARADETLIAHFRVAPPADAYMLWVCGTQVTGSNSADILGDGVWCYDHETRMLTVMKDATYNITNDGFIVDMAGSGVDEPLTVSVGNHNISATCTTTDNVIRIAVVGTNGMTFTGTTYHGLTVTAQNMYAANFSKPLTVTGHMDLTLNLKNTTDWGKDNFKTAVLLAGVTPSLIVNGANLYINSGVGESAGSGYKVTNKTNQAANLSLNNASIQWGSISSQDLGILDDSPQYEINYITPSLESLCLTSVFGLSFFEGTYVDLRAYPATGYKFVSWSDGNTDNPRLIIMPAQNVYLDPIVEVDDSQTPKGAIINASATEGQGSIVDFTSGWYAEGTELTITAVAAEGYEFVQWTDGVTDNPYFITVEDGMNISITAMFRKKTQGFEEVNHKSEIITHKFLKDGVLYIERNGKTYNALGAEVQ